jgi:DNA-binding IclR family transcriptional regulator
MRLPANCSATGKALLSTLPEAKVSELCAAGGFRRLTTKSTTDLRALLKQLTQVRKNGYSVDDEETRERTICFGAPVFDSASSHAVAGVGVSFWKPLNPHQKALAIQAIRQLSASLSARLGARGLSIPGI